MHVFQSSAGHHRGFLIILLSLIGLPLPGAVAAIDHAPIVSLGASNTPMQRDEVLEILGASSSDQVVTVTVDDTVQAMEGVFDVSGIEAAYSSTALTCAPEGSGIAVRTHHISLIPPDLYALVLLTAGMRDIALAVAAPSDAPALGMTAMTGVFSTWDMASCLGSGRNPLRRQLALEELALITEIGQEPDAVRRLTRVVLEAQQEITRSRITTAYLDSRVTSHADAAGVTLGDDDRAAIVAFLERLSQANLDWGSYAHGWSTQAADDSSGVTLVANADPGPGGAGQNTLPGMGGVTGPIAPASPIASVPPDDRDAVLAEATPVPPTVGDAAPTAFLGTVTDSGRELLTRWWPLAATGVLLLLLVVGAHRQPSEIPTTWYVSRSRMFWLGRTLRRPHTVIQSPRRGHGRPW